MYQDGYRKWSVTRTDTRCKFTAKSGNAILGNTRRGDDTPLCMRNHGTVRDNERAGGRACL